MGQCGSSLTQRVNYTINVADYGTEATTIVAKMKASGVSTVLCICDPIMPILLSQEADQQKYYPEWFGPSWGDPDSRNFAADQQDHTIALGSQFPPMSQEEASNVFRVASGGRSPAEQYFYVAYYQLLPIFAALQDAGPDLTVGSFERGWFSMPTVIPGTINGGAWAFGPGAFNPNVSEHLVWWDPSATSQSDEKTGRTSGATEARKSCPPIPPLSGAREPSWPVSGGEGIGTGPRRCPHRHGREAWPLFLA